jgi:hypothetical protein
MPLVFAAVHWLIAPHVMWIARNDSPAIFEPMMCAIGAM